MRLHNTVLRHAPAIVVHFVEVELRVCVSWSRGSFGPKSEWKAGVICAIHEAMIRLRENPFVCTLDSFEHQRCSGAGRGTVYLESNLTSCFLRTVAGAQADMLHRQPPRIFFASVGNLLGDDAAQFIFAEITGLSIDLYGLCPGRYGESAKHRNQNNRPQEYLP
jgi:hypothetical protein